MPFPALLLIIAALLPLASWVVLLAMGRRLGTPLAGYVAIFFIAISFLCSGWAMMDWLLGGSYNGVQYGQGAAPIVVAAGGEGVWRFGIYIDSVAVSMFLTITLCALLVHIFVTRSMRREVRFVRFFTILSLSCFSVLGLVLCISLLHQVLFLELSCLCSSMLVGFRFDREPTVRAAARMFVVSRVGDIALIFGLGILFAYAGSLTWPGLWATLAEAGRGGAVMLAGGAILPQTLVTLAGSALFLGIAGRMAQFPLQVWAADVAEGVAPAAAMVLVLTQSLAAIFLLARLFPILTPSARLLIAIIGVTTLTMGCLIACTQTGIKQVLTWLAASQLGFIVLALGLGSWSGAMFHLIGYSFFQVLLFLAAGAVIRASRGETQLLKYGGLVRKMPATAITSAVAILAACGAGSAGIGLSGYYSRGMVLQDAASFASAAAVMGRSRAYWMFFILPVMAGFLTTFALVRWWLLIFSGAPRDQRLHDHAREAPTLLWPLVILAIMTALAGKWLGVMDLMDSAIVETRQAIAARAPQDVVPHFFNVVRTTEEESPEPEPALGAPAVGGATRAQRLAARWLVISLACGVLSGTLVYLRGPRFAERLVRIPPLNWLNAWLSSRMYFDDLYTSIFVTLTVGLAGLLAWGDDHMVRPLARLLLRV